MHYSSTRVPCIFKVPSLIDFVGRECFSASMWTWSPTSWQFFWFNSYLCLQAFKCNWTDLKSSNGLWSVVYTFQWLKKNIIWIISESNILLHKKSSIQHIPSISFSLKQWEYSTHSITLLSNTTFWPIHYNNTILILVLVLVM